MISIFTTKKRLHLYQLLKALTNHYTNLTGFHDKYT